MINRDLNSNRSKALQRFLIALLIPLFTQPGADAQDRGPFKQVFSFALPQNAYPGPLVQGQDGNLYGTTAARYGTIYRLMPNGTINTLFAFGLTNGAEPNAIIQARDRNFYGTTRGGGAFGNSRGEGGTVFKLSPSGAFETLISFSGTNGWAPQFLVEGKDGNFYGATAGSPVSGAGRTIFKMTPEGRLTNIATLDLIEGDQVLALVSGQDGSIYGTTSRSGGNGNGEIFRLDTAGNVHSIASFGAVDWLSNGSTLAQGDDGSLYGTVWHGPLSSNTPEEPSPGAFFRVSAEGTLTALASFSGRDGPLPSSLVRGSDGSFYGTTKFGGGRDIGAIFKLTTSGAHTILADFDGENGSGWSGASLVQGVDGNVYGTTYEGGSGGYGTVFRIDADGQVEKLHDFPQQEGGRPWFSTLLPDREGDLFGTVSGGPFGNQTFWVQITKSGALTNAVSLNSLSNTVPDTLVEHSSGDFYGTSSYGGANGLGAIVKVARSGAAEVLASFSVDNRAAFPSGALIEDHTGSLLGITQGGGAHYNGTVYSISPTGTLTVLASFDGGNPVIPQGPLVLGADGTLFGTTREGGGPQRRGTVFALSPSGRLTTLVAFDEETTGIEPSSLTKDADGNLYGTTWSSVFKVTPEGAITLYPLPGIRMGPLIQGGDGFLYGLTGTYGYNFRGVFATSIFRVSPSGESAALYSAQFDGFSSGSARLPLELLRGANGWIYATTFGGTLDAGGVFQVLAPPSVASISRQEGKTHVTWAGFPGQNYQVEVATDLAAPDWAKVGHPFTPTNSITTSIDDSSRPQGFYRVELSP